MMGNISVALCIPTYERSNLVQDFLINCSGYYIQAGIDIYYYDSSVSDETKDIVCSWPDQDHIHYVRMPSEMHANEKAYKFLQGHGLKKEYDFIWLSNDAMQCTKEAIEQLMSALSLEYDIIDIVGGSRVSMCKNLETRIFTDSNEYMQKCALNLMLFGASLLNAHTMLNGVDWVSYEEKFLTQPVIYWSHISFYFNRILELDKFCALHLTMGTRSIRFSRLKKTRFWTGKLFYCICEGWVKTIETLPNCYTDKNQVILDGGNNFLENIDRFYRYKQRGAYSLKIFLKYRTLWNRVSSVPQYQLFFVAIIPKFIINLFFNLQQSIGEMKLKKFCAVHKKVYIFGTGATGDIYAHYFDKLGLNYEAFCVSKRKVPQQEKLCHPVYEFSELKQSEGNIGIVIAMIESTYEKVFPVVKETFSDKDIFYNPKFSNLIRCMQGYDEDS